MPLPTEVRDGPYLLVAAFDKKVGPTGSETRSYLQDRSFHAYLELYFQGKHDGAVRTYCAKAKPRIECRGKDGTQVEYGRRETFEEFYLARAETACARVAKFMEDSWKNAPKANHGTFVRGAKNIMAVQGERQRDGHGYDLSFWYDGTDIYVTFHCYPK